MRTGGRRDILGHLSSILVSLLLLGLPFGAIPLPSGATLCPALPLIALPCSVLNSAILSARDGDTQLLHAAEDRGRDCRARARAGGAALQRLCRAQPAPR